jgi:hypothetical protein
MAHTLADVVEIRLTPAGHDRWRHFRVQNVMSDGTIKESPAVNTKQQALRRRNDWFPNAAVTVLDPNAPRGFVFVLDRKPR